ncbi:MmcQ/YjbR family DNA-binding protein [Ruminococcus albus]|uniref:Predicted DNA-binding protein, MmcQ/YjbR family n=1 Tax=Ruminococcus albus TaxID=1264 RepID=A0A1H7HYR0_RUMAL|nr:MmcQ/YjbR family DNA-binding protein [Ruminococcus albus]SEK55254.1 Predicted DNA-binding protein, MmcQ/YjbR family [Ruminococcus albus]
MSRRETIISFIKKEYSVLPEYLFEGDFDTAVFRHNDTKKWFGIIMKVKRSTLGIKGEGTVDVMNVKCDPLLVDILVQRESFLRAYHMNKRLWVSILIDSEIDDGEIFGLIEQSFQLTDKKPKKKKQ